MNLQHSFIQTAITLFIKQVQMGIQVHKAQQVLKDRVEPQVNRAELDKVDSLDQVDLLELLEQVVQGDLMGLLALLGRQVPQANQVAQGHLEVLVQQEHQVMGCQVLSHDHMVNNQQAIQIYRLLADLCSQLRRKLSVHY